MTVSTMLDHARVRGRAPFLSAAATVPASVGLVAAGLAAAVAGSGAQLAFAAVALLVVGLPHGASDHLVVRRGEAASPRRFAWFLAVYLAAVGATLALWCLAPDATLATFLLLSAAHFAIDDLPNEMLQARPVERIARGFAPVTLPALLHSGELARLFAALSSPAGGGRLAAAASFLAPCVLLLLAVALAGRLRAGNRRRGTELAALMTALVLLPPLVGFGLYFALVHSRGQTRERMRTLGFYEVFDYLVAIWPTLLGALLVFAGVGATLAFAPQFELRTLFIGLASLTVPHMLVTPLFASRP